MDIDLSNLLKDNENKKFIACNHNWMVIKGELCIQLENDEYVPVYTDYLSPVLQLKIWNMLISKED
jgi:hypothetical protein